VGEGVGWHAFRRYFVSFRRAQGMPEDVLKRLVGHASGSDITSLYNRFGNLPAERREWVERIGLGFDLPRDAT
jgi:integrase